VPRKVLVTQPDGSAFDLTETPAPNEHHLQEVMKEHPALLPVDDLGISGPLLVVGRETSLASGSVDLIGVVPAGELVLVEFKTGPQNPDFRHALAQLIDYGSDLWGMAVSDFDSGVVQRYLDSTLRSPGLESAGSLRDMAEQVWTSDEFNWDEFEDRLARVLSDGDFHYVVAAQKFTPQMTRSLDYLNNVARVGHYHLVQMVQLSGHEMTGYAAQSVAGPAKARRLQSVSGVNETSFLNSLDDDAYREALSDIFSTCRTLGLSFEWGVRGASIRMATPDRAEPISIGWIFPDGYNWSGLRFLTLGYDTASARYTPSVAETLDSYVANVSRIDGGSPVKAKTIKAWTWTPAAAPSAKEAIIQTLEQLVSTVGGETATEDAGHGQGRITIVQH
jgi:hypothetical protein